MIRTALRLATMAVLTNGGAEPWPTLAKDYVYDSRRDKLDDVRERMRRPVIVVRTDDDARTNRVGSQVGPLQARSIDLLLEISVVSASKKQIPNPAYAPGNGQPQFIDDWEIGWPQTDAAIETQLDLLEYQIESVLFGPNPWGLWWQDMPWRRADISSTPMFTREAIAIRLAARTMRFTMLAPGECMPGWRFDHEPATPATLPDPLLSVFSKIATDGAGDLKISAQQLYDMLVNQTWPEETAFPQLTKVPIDTGINGDNFG